VEAYVVIWQGEMLEKDSPDAIVFSEADARALIATSPGRKESYDVERWALETLLASPRYASSADAVRQQVASGDRSPIWLRDEAERKRRE
jgi:hypothetical protein